MGSPVGRRYSASSRTRVTSYNDAVSIELEDMHFNGSEAGEKQGILLGAQFLEGC